MKRKSILAALVAVGVTAGASYGITQQRGPGWGMMGQGMPMRHGMMDMMANCPMPGSMMGMGDEGQVPAFVEGRIAFLKAELGVTDAQKGAWEAYADALKRNLQGMLGMAATMKAVFEAKTPVDRLEAHLAAMESRINTLKDVKPALAKLYDSLSAEQKKKADEILTGMGCMM
jgi:hypothetical protein